MNNIQASFKFTIWVQAGTEFEKVLLTLPFTDKTLGGGALRAPPPSKVGLKIRHPFLFFKTEAFFGAW